MNNEMKIGFDNEKYLKMQSEHIRQRIAQFGDKLYLEFGGKLYDDYHASRVLPGFKPDSKLQMLLQLKDEAEIVIVINSDDIEKNKVRGDLGITYDIDVLRLVNVLFTEEEREHYIDFEIIRDNNPKDEDKIVATCGIITMNEKGILKDEEHNKYYIYINGELKRILKRTLIRNIITGTLGFIDSEEQYIPGIR